MQNQTAISILCDGTIKAAGLILLERGITTADINFDRLANAIKTVINANLTDILAEWKAATEARIGEGWLRELLNTQCNQYARKAVEDYLKVGFLQDPHYQASHMYWH